MIMITTKLRLKSFSVFVMPPASNLEMIHPFPSVAYYHSVCVVLSGEVLKKSRKMDVFEFSTFLRNQTATFVRVHTRTSSNTSALAAYGDFNIVILA